MATHSSTLVWKIPWTGAWQGAVHGITKSWTLTERLHFHFSLFTFMHWRRKSQSTPVFLPGESQGRESLVGCHLWGHTELDTTEATQQQQQHTYVPSLLKLPPTSHHIPPLQVVTEHQFEFPESYSKSHWLSILYVAIYMFPCCCLHLPRPLLPPLCPQVCSLCLRLQLLPCRQVHRYQLPRFHTYTLTSSNS